jgi:hypothetical protein
MKRTIKLHWKAFKVDIQYYWRRLTGKCTLCSAKLVQLPKCLWCQTYPTLCHMCGKRFGHASNYGISKRSCY